jgi:hypothetical protein
MKQAGFFDVDERLARLSGLGDQFEAFSRTARLCRILCGVIFSGHGETVFEHDGELASGGFEKPSGFETSSVIPFSLR